MECISVLRDPLSKSHIAIVNNMSRPLLNPYPPQTKAVHEILTIFREGEVHYVLLRAPLQAGKTGTYQYLARMMLVLGMVDSVYVVCGSNEKELLKQVNADVEEWHGADVLGKNVHVVFRQHFPKVTMATRRVLIINDESHVDCQLGQQLHHFLDRHDLTMAGTTPRMKEDRVYMVSVSATPFAEESVMAHGDSLPKRMVRLTVDETYYGPAEYRRDGLLQKTFSVLSEDGQARFRKTVQDVWAKGKYVLIRIRESAVATRQARRAIHAMRGGGDEEKEEEEEEKAVGRYSVTEAEGVHVLLEELVKETQGARILHFTSAYTGPEQQIVTTEAEADAFFEDQIRRNPYHARRIPSLDVAPSAPTIVLLDGRLRYGKRLHKEHIGMTWDTATESSTDVILQGLVGRMCGYLGNGYGQVPLRKEDRPLLFTSHSLFPHDDKLRESDKTVKLSDLERFHAVEKGVCGLGVDAKGQSLLVPRFANHLLRPELEKELRRPSTNELVYQCAPLRFSLSEEGVRRLEEGVTDRELARLCWEEFVPRLNELVELNQELTLLQKSEICSYVLANGDRGSHIRRYQGTSNMNMYRHMVHAYHQRTAVEKDRIGTGDPITFCAVFGGFAGVSGAESTDPAGTVYVSIYTKSPGFLRVIPLSSRIAPHDGKTHFIRQEIKEEEQGQGQGQQNVMVGTARYGFTSTIEYSPMALETELDFFIRVALSGVGHFERVFTSVAGQQGIPLAIEAYGEDLAVLRAIISRLEANHQGIRINYVRHPARKMTHLFLKSIGWK